jgi:hypothetical protein
VSATTGRRLSIAMFAAVLVASVPPSRSMAASPAPAAPASVAPYEIFDAAGQRQRAAAWQEAFVRTRVDYFTDDGNWCGPAGDKPYRGLELGSYLVPFLRSGNPVAVARANAIYANSEKYWKGCFETADSYQPMPETIALLTCRGLLTDAARLRMEKICATCCERFVKLDRWEFQGDNDNFPLLANACLAGWGVYTKNPELIRVARSRYEQYRDILTRCGFGSEFNSPSYIVIHLFALAAAAELVDDPAFRKLALDLETRVWMDLLTHYHPPTGVQAGPSSRCYNFDIYGSQLSRFHVYLLFGDRLLGKWDDAYRTDTPEYGLARSASRSTVRYHCPAWLGQWVLDRKYPCTVIGSAEGGASYTWFSPDRSGSIYHWMWKNDAARDGNLYTLPAWHTSLTLHQTETYSLGTASRMFNEGSQNNSFLASVPLADEPNSTRQVARVHARYVINETVPGVTLLDDYTRRFQYQLSLTECGRTVTVQKDSTAMVLYRPHAIAGFKPASLKAMVIIPNRDHGRGDPAVDELYIGGRKCDGVTGDSNEPATVFVRMHKTYMALIPLIDNSAVGAKLPRQAAVRVRPEGWSLGVSLYNYQGDGVDLNPRQYCLMGNGFVCEMGDEKTDGSFDRFRARLADDKHTVTSLYRRTVHSRGAYTRQVTYQRDGLKLEIEYEPITEGIRYRTIDGRCAPEPQLDAPGLPKDKAPLLE